MIDVYVADDHPIVCEGIRRVLDGQADIRVSGAAHRVSDLLRDLASTPVDVLLLDLSMPGPGFTEVIRRVRSRRAGTAILAISMHPEETHGIRALRAGVRGYLNKADAVEQLATAIRRIHGGHMYLSPALAEQLALEVQDDQPRAAHERLSDREFEVLRMLGSGWQGRDIALRLGVSPKTVSTYRARIVEKTGLRSTPEFVRHVLEHGLQVAAPEADAPLH